MKLQTKMKWYSITWNQPDCLRELRFTYLAEIFGWILAAISLPFSLWILQVCTFLVWVLIQQNFWESDW